MSELNRRIAEAKGQGDTEGAGEGEQEMARNVLQAYADDQIKRFDDKGLTIARPLLMDLLAFEHLCEDALIGIAYLHFTDWYGFIDLPALETAELVHITPGRPRNGGWREHFPQRPYTLTVKARVILKQPGKYVVDTDAGT